MNSVLIFFISTHTGLFLRLVEVLWRKNKGERWQVNLQSTSLANPQDHYWVVYLTFSNNVSK